MSFPKYEAYKDSGVEWLGEVPEHWNIVPIKYVASLNPKKSDYQGEKTQTCSFVPMEKLKTGTLILDEERTISDVYTGYTYFENGDILQAKVTPCFENKNIALAENLINGVGFGSSEINVLRASESILNWFLYYRLQENGFMDFCTASMMGVAGLKRIPTETINDFSIALPERDEQTQIARFLDHETARIDALIAEQQRLIELLKEKRQAVISHAVTKGLDPTAPMKDSGIEWLGQVPAHWLIIKLGLLASERCDGPFGSALKSEHYTDVGIRVIRLQNIKSGWFNDEDSVFIDTEYYRQNINKSDVKDGDLLIAGLGDENNPVGRACVAPMDISPAMVKADCFRFRLLLDLAVPEYIADQLTAGSEADGGRLSTGSTRSRIPLSSMSTRIIALPPIAEQKLIIQFIRKNKEETDILLSEANSAVSLLQERRSALISAAVTGKIDVRRWQAPASAAPAPTLAPIHR